jgi:transcription elongation factor Elf1
MIKQQNLFVYFEFLQCIVHKSVQTLVKKKLAFANLEIHYDHF